MSKQHENLSKPELEERVQALELLLLDVDGVLTDGGIFLIGEDQEMKKFDVQDGMGVTLVQRAGIEVGIITGRVSGAVKKRAEELEIEKIYQGHFWKEEALEEILQDYEPHQLAYIGDDVLDVPVMRRVGLPLAPANALPEVKDECLQVAEKEGGAGAVRELADWLLELRGEKEEIYDYYRTSGEGA